MPSRQERRFILSNKLSHIRSAVIVFMFILNLLIIYSALVSFADNEPAKIKKEVKTANTELCSLETDSAPVVDLKRDFIEMHNSKILTKEEDKAKKAEIAKQAKIAAEKAAEAARAAEMKSIQTNVSAPDEVYAIFQDIVRENGISPADAQRWATIIYNESRWQVNATNPKSGAYGLPQSLPAHKMASHGADWRTNPRTQLLWMLDYMKQRYGSIKGALDFWDANHWY